MFPGFDPISIIFDLAAHALNYFMGKRRVIIIYDPEMAQLSPGEKKNVFSSDRIFVFANNVS